MPCPRKKSCYEHGGSSHIRLDKPAVLTTLSIHQHESLGDAVAVAVPQPCSPRTNKDGSYDKVRDKEQAFGFDFPTTRVASRRSVSLSADYEKNDGCIDCPNCHAKVRPNSRRDLARQPIEAMTHLSHHPRSCRRCSRRNASLTIGHREYSSHVVRGLQSTRGGCFSRGGQGAGRPRWYERPRRRSNLPLAAGTSMAR